MEKPVVFRSNNYTLVGILHLPLQGKPNKKFPGVILCHGFSGNKAESHFIFTRLARCLAKNGMVCFRFDFMGSGDSSGDFEHMTLQTEIQDAENALKYLVKQPFIDRSRIGILGLSMGAIPATAVSSKQQLKSLCLWSSVAFPQEIEKKILTRRMKKILAEKGNVYLTGSGLRIGQKFIESLHKIDPITLAKNIRGNVLVIHSKDDTVINVSHALAYYNAFHCLAKERKLVILEKGGHTFVMEETEKIVIQETIKFFRQTLFT
ncbi:MAG: alpha/beta fold hydrolase [Candidatus Omnitrophica bacterium]|nr:alpha/beta fold hydrolase [Candidatus Omnitrophota bacterium]MCM8817422.1 alpha/beta fold hydrolase [Candidatus Omnitrophota bacterium]